MRNLWRRYRAWMRGEHILPSQSQSFPPDQCSLQIIRLDSNPDQVAIYMRVGVIVTITTMSPDEAREMAQKLCRHACMAQESLPIDSDESDLT